MYTTPSPALPFNTCLQEAKDKKHDALVQQRYYHNSPAHVFSQPRTPAPRAPGSRAPHRTPGGVDYVNQLCSPTRSSLLSGRYAYKIKMNGEVIVDGSTSCMPSSVATVADRLTAAGWATAAFGKWDLGMSYWGCTPTCRGFGHFHGFYDAGNNYFSHRVGGYLDFRERRGARHRHERHLLH